MNPRLIYEQPQPISEEEVLAAIEKDNVDRLLLIPIALGLQHDNWRFTQDISVRLAEHRDPRVRANALFGIEYAARFHGRVEKNIIKPVLLRALNDPSPEVCLRAQETIEAINQLMKWNIGGAARQKKLERRFNAGRAR